MLVQEVEPLLSFWGVGDRVGVQLGVFVGHQVETHVSFHQVYADSLFARALDGMPGQVKPIENNLVGGDLYKVTGRRVEAGCGYIIWSWFRDYLAVSFTRAGGRQCIANDPVCFVEEPFFDLIWFSDCDGCMGPVASRRVADAFNAHTCQNDRWRGLYERVSGVFNNAADTGIVRFW